jgi:hypothetical protein
MGGDMTKADLHQLIDSLPDEAVDGAALLLQRVMLGQVDPAQAWVWTAEWQDQLRQSLADLATGRTQRFDSDEDFLASL